MFNLVFRDVGSQTAYTPLFKQVPIIPIAMAAASIGSSIYNTLSSKNTNKQAIANQDKLFAMQNARQTFLMQMALL